MASAGERIRGVVARRASALLFAREAPFYARYTFPFHMSAEILIGVFFGIYSLVDFVSRKTLKAPDAVLALQTSVPMMAFGLAMVWRDLLARVDRRRVLLACGILGKGAMLLVAFVFSPAPLLGIVVVYAIVDSVFVPVRNEIFRANYRQEVRGRYYSRVAGVNQLVMVGVNLGAATILRQAEWTYRILFPAAAVVGVAAHVIYARIRVRRSPNGRRSEGPAVVPRSLAASVATAVRTTVRLLRENPGFRRYEVGFFIYGIAFLVNLPLAVFLIVDVLDLDYDSAALARTVLPPLMFFLLAPTAGRLLDRTNPARTMAFAGVLLAVHSGLLFVTDRYWMLLASYVLFGAGMTAVNLTWNLGPLWFAPTEREAGDYMAVHVTLVGLRAVIAPALALAAKAWLGIHAGFALSAALYLTAAVLMFRLGRDAV